MPTAPRCLPRRRRPIRRQSDWGQNAATDCQCLWGTFTGMRASRLVRVLLLLQARGRRTAAELAAELDVSVRTVYRDVESLSAAGVPVYADRGPAGGYRLVDGYRTRLTGMTAGEAESLFLAGMPGPAAELGLGTVLAAAELKLLAALPPELRSRAVRVRERFHMDAPGWFREADEVPWLAAVADAVWNQHALRVHYRRWGAQEVTRVIEPLGIVLKAGTWYLVAAPASSGARAFRPARRLRPGGVVGLALAGTGRAPAPRRGNRARLLARAQLAATAGPATRPRRRVQRGPARRRWVDTCRRADRVHRGCSGRSLALRPGR